MWFIVKVEWNGKGRLDTYDQLLRCLCPSVVQKYPLNTYRNLLKLFIVSLFFFTQTANNLWRVFKENISDIIQKITIKCHVSYLRKPHKSHFIPFFLLFFEGNNHLLGGRAGTSNFTVKCLEFLCLFLYPPKIYDGFRSVSFLSFRVSLIYLFLRQILDIALRNT